MATSETSPGLPLGPPGQPDIEYTPNHDKYLQRAKRRRETEHLVKSLPAGFPQELQSKLVWDGNDLVETYDWNYDLSEEDLDEIDSALRHFKGNPFVFMSNSIDSFTLTSSALNTPLGFISQETFPLPTLHSALRAISHEIHSGHGFKVVRGVPVTRYTREENVIIYTGISSHIAPVRGRQDNRYDGQPADVVLAHIKDLTANFDASKIGAPAYTTERQVFHTDVGDLIALFALGEAAKGGQSYLSSSWKVYNELAATRPDLIQTLSEPWLADTYVLLPPLFCPDLTTSTDDRAALARPTSHTHRHRCCTSRQQRTPTPNASSSNTPGAPSRVIGACLGPPIFLQSLKPRPRPWTRCTTRPKSTPWRWTFVRATSSTSTT